MTSSPVEQPALFPGSSEEERLPEVIGLHVLHIPLVKAAGPGQNLGQGTGTHFLVGDQHTHPEGVVLLGQP